MTPEEQRQVRARQKSRAIVTGLLLGALAILFYAIAIAKIGGGRVMAALLPPSPFDRDRRNRRTLVAMAGVGLAMLGLGFASVPLYRIFCERTGFGGTTQRAAADVQVQAQAGHSMSIRFDSNVTPGMPWQFYPEHRTDTVTIGARDMAIFIAKNMSDKPVTGTASFNVTPTQAGAYFTKIQCFCFTQQTLKPGEEVRMPVIYYVDPKILQDADNKDTQQITLSYTFYPVEQDRKPG